MKIHPCAKINLGLNIVEKRSDGYHNLETVFYPVPIHDEIEITERGRDEESSTCMLTMDGIPIEGDIEKNLTVRAYRIIEKQYSIPPVHIHLTKNIPMQAGMGGGSSDCAYTIRLLNDMFSLKMSTREMEGFAAQLGADCAFFIQSVPSYAEGIGEKLVPIDLSLDKYSLVIVKPPIAVSTREAFARICPKRPDNCCRDIVMQPVETWRNILKNDFEDSIFTQHPRLATIKQQLYDIGAVYAAMSGSGSALFALFDHQPEGVQECFKDCFVECLMKSV